MKLAMSVGTNRHYQLHTIAPRHFVQTARAAGMPTEIANEVLIEIAEQMPRAMEEAMAGLPEDFVPDVTASIRRGIEQRLQLLSAA